MLKPDEIVFCNLILQHGKKEIVLNKVVYKETDGYYHPGLKNDDLVKHKVKEPLKVLKVDVIVSLGFSNKSSF